jgi:hypothetical protein
MLVDYLFFQIFSFIGSSVICLSLSEIHIPHTDSPEGIRVKKGKKFSLPAIFQFDAIFLFFLLIP